MSARGQAIRESIEEPLAEEYVLTVEEKLAFKARYHNSSFQSLKLLVGRELLLWTRDRYQIKARLMQGKSNPFCRRSMYSISLLTKCNRM